MSEKLKRRLWRILLAAALYGLVLLLCSVWKLPSRLMAPYDTLLTLALYLIPYFVTGYDVLWRALRNILHGQVFDENFLMCVATIGALALGEYSEAVFVLLFYQLGEFFQDYALGRSRSSISKLMELKPESATLLKDGVLTVVAPEQVPVGARILVKAGERVPLDGVIEEGSTTLDTSALTGESLPRSASVGDEILSGTVNLTGSVTLRTVRAYEASAVSRILELAENASDKKAVSEQFITRFARVYTPAVCAAALLIAFLPPLLFSLPFSEWIERGLIFLVVSCPCALVISVPLTFFGGIGGASRRGILIKGSGYLETLARTETVVFDKTGTLTSGSFRVTAVHPDQIDEARLIELTALAESRSDHPVAHSVREAYGRVPDQTRVGETEELAGLGIRAMVDGQLVLAGNAALMREAGVAYHDCHLAGTAVHVAVDGVYGGHIIISDSVKPDAKEAIGALRALGVRRLVMLTGDREAVAAAAAKELGLDEYCAELLPADKVGEVERLLGEKSKRGSLAFVGDGINDAPVLARADTGVAMGSLGSDAAIEAADVVLMDDRPMGVANAVRIARGTKRIVRENVLFALGVKLIVLVLAACGVATMGLAAFADVGVAVLAILNALRALRLK